DSSHERLEAPLGARRAANKVPFTDEELHCIIRACDQLQPIPWSNGKTGGVWTGDDVKDFIWVLVYTGLRISNVGLFNISAFGATNHSSVSKRMAVMSLPGFLTGCATVCTSDCGLI